MNSFPLYPNCNPQEVYQNFLRDVEKSAKGEKTSLRWIINQLPQTKSVPDGGMLQTMVVGGTVCKSALVKNTGGNPEIITENDIPKPPFPTGESFLQFIAENISQDVDTVVINAADTIQPVVENGVMDGIFLVSTKENKMEGLLGKKLGEEISKYYFEKYGRSIHVHIVNDTICLMLSGLTEFQWDNLAAGILGTGLNLAIFLDEKTAVNLEAGGYTDIIQSEPGKEIDRESAEKGEYLIEKETAGGYLYRHFNYWIRKKGLDIPEITDSSDLDLLAQSTDQEVARLAEEILQYSATLFGCQIAGILQFLGKDTTFIMNGSLFWKGYHYKEIVEEVVASFVPKLHAHFAKVDQADIVGAAKVVM